MASVPTTVEFPRPLPAERVGPVSVGKTGETAWVVELDGHEQKVSNLDKLYWKPEGYTKADLLAYYVNIADWILPFLRDRALTLKRMPDGADGPFFYAKQAPAHTPSWMPRATVTSLDEGPSRWGGQESARKTITYLLAQDRASLVYLANLGCIEMHPWHSRIDALGRPDYAFFDLDPFNVPFATVREVALLIREALDRLGLRSYPRTSGSTGIHIYVPIDREHSFGQVREWVNRVCRIVNHADPERTTMEWQVSERVGVFLDAGMNTEGRNIAAAYSLRPERDAPVSTPLRWEDVATDVEPHDFTIRTIWDRLDEVGDIFTPVLEGGQTLHQAMAAVGMDPTEGPAPAGHVLEEEPSAVRPAEPSAVRPAEPSAVRPAEPSAVRPEEPGELASYEAKRDFARTPEPPSAPLPDAGSERRFVIQHHLATRLHHDLRLERGGTLRSWAVPKGLPAVPDLRHLAVQTEDHPMEYLTFSGDIPKGEYGGGAMRIWDTGTYETVEWTDRKVTVRLRGARHYGEWHLFRTGRDDPSQWMVTRAGAPEELPPDPPVLEPMLASSVAEPFDRDGWLFEVKWDGVRAVATVRRPGDGREGSTRLLTRNGNDVTVAYPELASLWERVLARNAVLDGEIVAFAPDGRPSFHRLAQRMHVRELGSIDKLRRSVPVVYMAFDLLVLDGESLVDQPLCDRLELLEQVLVPGTAVKRSEPIEHHGRALYEAADAQGLEGIVAKRGSSPYQPGRRSKDWLKIKVRRPGCFVIGGWLPEKAGLRGENAQQGRGRGVGSLLLGGYEDGQLMYLGRVGTGFDAPERARLTKLLEPLATDQRPFATMPDDLGPKRPFVKWVRPELSCEIEYGEVTPSGHLRATSYMRLTPDVDPASLGIPDPDPSGT